jgi:hypothetical protein
MSDQSPLRVIPLQYAPREPRGAVKWSGLISWSLALAGFCCIFAELLILVVVESVLFTGPILFTIGVLLVVEGLRLRRLAIIGIGVAHCAICVLFVGLVNVLHWNPSQARTPFLLTGALYDLVIIPFTLLLYDDSLRTNTTTPAGGNVMTTNPPSDLSPALFPLYHLEVAMGNTVLRVDRKRWSRSPMVVVFRNPLQLEAVAKELQVEIENVSRWENRDTHYDLEAGWRCEQTGHCLSGPLPG